MGEWALPADQGLAFELAVKTAEAEGAPWARWLRGGFWRNFQVKYREINDLHKQMLRVSGAVERMAPGAARESALDHLFRGQSNDCYWHGLFGGIYIAHMRAATLAHLIAAEDAADRALGIATGSELRDLDLDGRDEVRLATDGEVVALDLDEGGGIGAWDIRAARHALAGVLRRRPEAYHETLRRHEARAGGKTRQGQDRRRRARLDSRHRPGEGAGARRAPRLRRLRAPLGADPDPARRSDTRSVGRGRPGRARRLRGEDKGCASRVRRASSPGSRSATARARCSRSAGTCRRPACRHRPGRRLQRLDSSGPFPNISCRSAGRFAPGSSTGTGDFFRAAASGTCPC